MSSDYTKIFSGNSFISQNISTALKEVGIEPIVKDESESARLAGFAANIDGYREIHVHNGQIEEATAIVNGILASSKD